MSGSSARNPRKARARRSSRRLSSPQSPDPGPPWKRLNVTTRSRGAGSERAGATVIRRPRTARTAARRTTRSVRERLARRREDAPDVGHGGALAGEADEGNVVGGDATDGRLQREERALHDRGGDLGAGAEALGRLVHDERSEERRVGKECRSRGAPDQ